jgi:hypothetical protein
MSFLELTPGTCSPESDTLGVLTADEMMSKRLVQLCWTTYAKQGQGAESGIAGVSQVKAMFTTLRGLNENCSGTRNSCSFKDKIRGYDHPAGESSTYLGDAISDLSNANPGPYQRHGDADAMTAYHDTMYHSNQPETELDLDSTQKDTTNREEVLENRASERVRGTRVGTDHQPTKGSTAIGNFLRKLSRKRSTRKSCESGALVIDHEALIFRMRST